MADVISGLVSDVSGSLTSLAIEEFGLFCGFKRDISSLKEEFDLITKVLKDAEKKHEHTEVVQSWLKSIRSESLKMENVLDDVSAEAMLQKLYKELGFKYMVRAFFFSNHLMFRIRMAHEVKNIRIQLDKLKTQYSGLYSNPSGADEGVAGEMPYRQITSYIHPKDVLGRDEEIKRVMGKICNSESDILVYVIWGMGGLGKTTLAQLAYKEVKEHFDFKCWVYVSQNFRLDELIRMIIKSIDGSERQLSRLEDMQNCLQEKLRRKRFLIVLDDVWIQESDMEKWEELSKTLRCGAQGSIVMLTTREKITTSLMMGRIPKSQHQLGCLSEEDSWSLFKMFAFEGREGGDITELEPIGKEIVEKCKGLPLAVKTLGGLMWSKSSAREWKLVRDSDIWELYQEKEILPALKLSYDNLPPHVKPCFAYCCMLPKGHKMGKDQLIWLWKANRLIPSRGEASWHATEEEIFNCLVWRSFFQVVDEEYIMHDLMHDLARYVMGHDCSIVEPGKGLRVPDEVLHLSSTCPDLASLQPYLEKLKSLRSVFVFAEKYNKEYTGSVSHIFNQVYLRVLCLDWIGLKTLPESICKLKHLRYLNLSNSRIEVLPESIIYLQNLQVLILNGCDSLRKLPEGMRYMRNLLYLDNFCDLSYLPVGIGKLTNLRRLSYFPLYHEHGGAQIGELGYLNLIGPDLILDGLKNVKGGLMEAQSANLKSKTHLLDLVLKWETPPSYDSYTSRSPDDDKLDDDKDVLEGLEPNTSLEKLSIIRYMGKNISSSWMVNLWSLVQIRFHGCGNCEHFPPLGKLPSLRVISMKYMSHLKYFHDEDMSGDHTLFSRLEELKISDCSELVSLPGNLPKLKILHLYSCRGLVSLPDHIQNFKDLNTLEIRACENLSRRYAKDIGVDWYKISHIPNINIRYSY